MGIELLPTFTFPFESILEMKNIILAIKFHERNFFWKDKNEERKPYKYILYRTIIPNSSC